MINFIDLFNVVAKVARPIHFEETKATSMEDTFEDLGIDSLDGLVMLMYMQEIYGIAEDDETKEWAPKTVQELYDLLMSRKTQEPESLEQVLKAIK
jgi:acyl carrier protein